MNKEEFKKMLLKFGFIDKKFKYVYNEWRIYFYNDEYHLYNGYEWFNCSYNDITPFKKLIRNIRLNELLG